MTKGKALSVALSVILAIGLMPSVGYAETSNDQLPTAVEAVEESSLEEPATDSPGEADTPAVEPVEGEEGQKPAEEDTLDSEQPPEPLESGDANPEKESVVLAEPVEEGAADISGDQQGVAAASSDELVTYSAHVSELGWQTAVSGGTIAGTTGRSLSMEALTVTLGKAVDGDLSLEAHVAGKGWLPAVGSGEVGGTTGESRQMEAVRLELTGVAADAYDVYYRAHVANVGWLDWAKNGEPAGSQGFAYAMEAIEIQLVAKGQQGPSAGGEAFKKPLWQVSYAQKDESTSATVVLPMLSSLKAEGITSVALTARMSYGSSVTREVKLEKKLAEIAEAGFLFDLETYGPFSVTADFKKGTSVVGSDTQTVGVMASEYNLAPLSATFPVVLFSLSLWDVTQNGAVPTIMMLDRPSAYDWDSLPAGSYAMPYLSEAAIKGSFDYGAFAQYVKDLYKLNPESRFNLYINDITCSLIHSIIYANGIPQDQYAITLMSDGTMTYEIYNEVYAVDDPEAKHQQLMDIWNAAKASAYKTGVASEDFGWHGHWDCMYAVLSCEQNVEWWVARKALFTEGGSVLDRLKSDPRVIQKSVGGMLGSLSGQGDAVVDQFKDLYDFNDGYFSAAEEQGKKVMVVLGTYPEPDLENYIRLVQSYYGDEYLYYYKGHPATPTGLSPEKQDLLDRLGVIDVDSAIAAELILFFNPGIQLSGYDSSLFDSVTDDEMACGLFNMRKADTQSSERYEGMDWFVTPITSTTEQPIRNLCPEDDVCYLVEFSDGEIASSGFDIAIFNASADTISYYTKSSDGYELKKTVNNAGDVRYSAHVAQVGWQGWMKDGGTAGTTGRALSMEALKVELPGQTKDSIRYKAHVAGIGWLDWVEGGSIAGTVGESRQMEALQIELTGEIAKTHDVLYRAHVAGIGWQDWVKNGEQAGTTGRSLGVEAIEVKLVPKDKI